MARYLVTGGAGYIGSHVVLALRERGDDVVVIDNLRQGHRAAIAPGAILMEGDVGDRNFLAEVFGRWKFDAVFHFAALSLVGESMREPLRYMAENVGNALWLAEAAVKADCKYFVLSSTAALFGMPDVNPIPENARVSPLSAYGESKLMTERGLEWAEMVHGLRFASLRYFNAAGADPLGRLGEDHDPETHLIPLAINAAMGIGPALTLYGTDYETPDGTPIRDYVHVTDLADAHLRALDELRNGKSVRYNVGNGQGYSVRQVLDMVHRVSGIHVPHDEGPRRAGDPTMLVASNARLTRELGWRPKHGSLEEVVRTAWAWRAANPNGFGDRG